MSDSEAGILLWEQLLELDDPPALYSVREMQFNTERRWRFDFAILPKRIAIEIEGGVFTQGRHVRGAGFVKDCEKYNHAALHGWRVLRFTPQQVLNGEAIAFIKRVLAASSSMGDQEIVEATVQEVCRALAAGVVDVNLWASQFLERRATRRLIDAPNEVKS